MNIKNLKIGMTIKNYKIMCDLLEEPIKAGRSKQIQLKNWSRYFNYSKSGNKFIINSFYENVIEKVRVGNNKGKYKKYEGLLIEDYQFELNGVYRILLNENIYIGSTTVGFRNRFLTHIQKSNPLTTRKMLSNGAIFEILWIAENNESEAYIRSMENQFINQYKDSENWNVVNVKEAWSFTESKPKIKYKKIKIEDSKYEEALKLLQENGLI